MNIFQNCLSPTPVNFGDKPNTHFLLKSRFILSSSEGVLLGCISIGSLMAVSSSAVSHWGSLNVQITCRRGCECFVGFWCARWSSSSSLWVCWWCRHAAGTHASSRLHLSHHLWVCSILSALDCVIRGAHMCAELRVCVTAGGSSPMTVSPGTSSAKHFMFDLWIIWLKNYLRHQEHVPEVNK